jgi:hypothetical protein
MTDKVTLSNVSSFVNDTTAVSTVNANSAAITTALDNTLSRDGTTPNAMGANIDMNSNRILNLPPPSSSGEPLRLADVSVLAGGSVTPSSLPVGGTAGQALVKNSSTNYDATWQNSLPTGGTSGQVLNKNSGTNYDVSWVSPTTGIPTAGTTGQALTKNSNTNYDAGWSTINQMTTGGTTGQYLKKNSNTNYDTSWGTLPNDLPVSGTAGQFLIKNSSTNYDASWGTLTPHVVTFSTLPGSPTAGTLATISDGLAGQCADGTCTTFGTNVTGGGGALKLLVWYNGTNWTLMGK